MKGKRSRRPMGVQLRLDGGLEWTEVKTGLYEVRDLNGIVRAHATQPDGETKWWRVFIEGERAPYDAPSIDKAQKLVEQLVRDQDERQTA